MLALLYEDMSTVQSLQIESMSLEETEQIAEQLGARLRGREVIELVSDLGGGKTAFVRGLARGAGSTDKVSSPTFTISNLYQTGDLIMHHFDFYRLHEAGIMSEELEELLHDPQAVVVIEWAGIIENILPPDRLTIRIKATGENSRLLTFEIPTALAYLTPTPDTK